MSPKAYTDPVAKLLTFGMCQNADPENWADYVTQFGFTEADIPELIRLATDSQFNEGDSESAEVWAPAHAWRVLAQLKAEAAIDPLLTLFELDDDWVHEEMPDVYARLGAASAEPLIRYLGDDSHDAWARILAADCLRQVASAHPECRDVCVAALTRNLENFQENDANLNATLIHNLVELRAAEAAPTIERVFTSGAEVDEFLTGSWASIQVDLGLKKPENFTPEELKPKLPPQLGELRKMLDLLDASTRKPKGFGGAGNKPGKSAKTKKKKKR